MAFSLVTSTTQQSTDGNPTTTSSIDTTGADLLIVVTAYYTGFGGSFAISDSKSNSWTNLTVSSISSYSTRISYCVSPSVGTGHTFSVGSGFGYWACAVQAWSGVNTSTPFDAEAGNTSSGASTLAAGSLTPAENNELLIAGAGWQEVSRTVSSIDSSYTLQNNSTSNGNAQGVAMAYLVQGTAATVNPTFTFSASTGNIRTRTACFKVAAAASGRIFKLAGDGGGLAGPSRGLVARRVQE